MKLILRTLILCAILPSMGLQAQSDATVPQNPPAFGFSLQPTIQAYIDAKIKEYKEDRGLTPTQNICVYLSNVGANYCSVLSFGEDGKIVHEGMTTEQALALYFIQYKDQNIQEWQEFNTRMEKAAFSRSLTPPSKIKVGSQQYILQHLEEWTKNPYVAADTNCSLKRVRIMQSDGSKQDSVLHEMMHVTSHCDTNIGTHRAIYQMSNNLLKILQDNPDLVEFLMKKPPVAEAKPTPIKKYEKTSLQEKVSAH